MWSVHHCNQSNHTRVAAAILWMFQPLAFVERLSEDIGIILQTVVMLSEII